MIVVLTEHEVLEAVGDYLNRPTSSGIVELTAPDDSGLEPLTLRIGGSDASLASVTLYAEVDE